MLPLKQNKQTKKTHKDLCTACRNKRHFVVPKFAALRQKYLSKWHWELFLLSKTLNFLYHTSDFSTCHRLNKVKKLKISQFLFICHKNLLREAQIMPSGKVVSNFKRYSTRGKGEGDKRRTYNYIVTICFLRETQHS